jgi:hypothetical protein
MKVPDELTPTEALGLIHELRSGEWKLHHIPTKSTWSGAQLKTAISAVANLPVEFEKPKFLDAVPPVPRRRVILIAVGLTLLGGYLLSLISGCSEDVPRQTIIKYATKTEAFTAAYEHAERISGKIFLINGTTGSMTLTNGARWGFAVVLPVVTRDLRIGDRVIRPDINVHHEVSRVEGPLVYTQGTSNQYPDATPISGEAFRVVAVYQY